MSPRNSISFPRFRLQLDSPDLPGSFWSLDSLLLGFWVNFLSKKPGDLMDYIRLSPLHSDIVVNSWREPSVTNTKMIVIRDASGHYATGVPVTTQPIYRINLFYRTILLNLGSLTIVTFSSQTKKHVDRWMFQPPWKILHSRIGSSPGKADNKKIKPNQLRHLSKKLCLTKIANDGLWWSEKNPFKIGSCKTQRLLLGFLLLSFCLDVCEPRQVSFIWFICIFMKYSSLRNSPHKLGIPPTSLGSRSQWQQRSLSLLSNQGRRGPQVVDMIASIPNKEAPRNKLFTVVIEIGS